jgi:Zn-dependent peptidase ImmA (M78 family)
VPFSPLPADREAEVEANEGAAEFLMPYMDCRNDLQGLRYSQLSILKQYWGVSKAMALFRAKEINAISADKCTNMYIELSRHGERKKETGFVELESPTLIDLIIQTYQKELGYSVNDILQILSINCRDYAMYFDKSIHSPQVKVKKVIPFNPGRVNEN